MSAKLKLIKDFILKNGELHSFKAGKLIVSPEDDLNCTDWL